VGAPTRAHALGMGPGQLRRKFVGRQIAHQALMHGHLITGFTVRPGSEVVDRRRAPRTRAHAPPSTPHGIASQGGVESPVARGRTGSVGGRGSPAQQHQGRRCPSTGSAVTCSRQCIRNFGAWCGVVPRVAKACKP